MVKVVKKKKVSKAKKKPISKIKKKPIIKKAPIAKPKIINPGNTIDKQLVQNFITLQKVMVNLSIKFDNLTTQISKLLELFEISAKALTDKDLELPGGKEVSKKIDNLLDQNKIIARGITMMHDRVTPPPVQQMPPQQMPQQIMVPQPMMVAQQMPPQAPTPPQEQKAEEDLNDLADYQKSISSAVQAPPKKFKKL